MHGFDSRISLRKNKEKEWGVKMKKPLLIIGAIGVGKTAKVKEITNEEIEFPRAQIVILEEIGNSLKEGESLSSLVQSILNVLPEAQVIMTLQSDSQLSNNDRQYAEEHFSITHVRRGEYVPA